MSSSRHSSRLHSSRLIVPKHYLLPALALVAGVGFFLLRKDPVTIPKVKTVAVKSDDFVKTVNGTGTARAESTHSLSFPPSINGNVTQINVKIGDQVSVGQELARIDVSNNERELEAARSSLSAAQADLARAQAAALESQQQKRRAEQTAAAQLESAQVAYNQAERAVKDQQRLFDLGAVSRQSLQTAQQTRDEAARKLNTARSDMQYARQKGLQGSQAAISQAQANVESAVVRVKNLEKSLSDAVLRAPAAGIISGLNLTVGSSPSQRAIEITNPQDLYLEVAFDETRTSGLKVGQPANILFDALSQKKFNGRVSRVDPVARNLGQIATIETRIMLEDPTSVKPGYTGSATVITRRLNNVLMVPLDTLEDQAGTINVWRVTSQEERHTAQRVPVKVVERNASHAVVEGLQAGDKVISPAPDPEKITSGAEVIPEDMP